MERMSVLRKFRLCGNPFCVKKGGTLHVNFYVFRYLCISLSILPTYPRVPAVLFLGGVVHRAVPVRGTKHSSSAGSHPAGSAEGHRVLPLSRLSEAQQDQRKYWLQCSLDGLSVPPFIVQYLQTARTILLGCYSLMCFGQIWFAWRHIWKYGFWKPFKHVPIFTTLPGFEII